MTDVTGKTRAKQVGYATKPNQPGYIEDGDTRSRVGNAIELSTSTAMAVVNGRKDGLNPAVAYHRAQIDLLELRPQLSSEDKARAKRTIAHHNAMMSNLAARSDFTDE